MRFESILLVVISALVNADDPSENEAESWRTYIPTFSDFISLFSVDPGSSIQLRTPIFAPYSPARVAGTLVGTGTGGRVFMYQEESNTDVLATVVAWGLAVSSTFTMEIHTSVSCANPGAIYNPLNVDRGGLVTPTTGATSDANGLMAFVRKNIPPTQVNLFANNNIIGRTIILRNAAGATVSCAPLIIG